MPGPAPKSPSERRRTNVAIAEQLLPRAGRKGPVPKWPLPGKPRAGESALWSDLWKTPQAVAWERLGWTRVVARYARVTVEAEMPDASASILAEVRQLEDRLGLSPMAMRRLMWKVDDRDDLAERAATKRPPAKPAWARLKVVDPDAVAGS